MRDFKSLGLEEQIEQGLVAQGFEHPSTLQLQVVPQILNHADDLVVLHQNNEEVTQAYLLPLIQLCDETLKSPQVLILSDQANYYQETLQKAEAYINAFDEVKLAELHDEANLNNAQFVLAKPQEILPKIESGVFSLEEVGAFVLELYTEEDLANFDANYAALIKLIPEGRQCIVMLNKDIEALKDKLQDSFKEAIVMRVIAENEKQTPQKVNAVHQARQKYPALKQLINERPDQTCIIYCRNTEESIATHEKLTRDGLSAAYLAKAETKEARQEILEQQSNKDFLCLTCTEEDLKDVAVKSCDFIVHFGLPSAHEEYYFRNSQAIDAEILLVVLKRDSSRIEEFGRITGFNFIQDESTEKSLITNTFNNDDIRSKRR